jgi:hypothetical protein
LTFDGQAVTVRTDVLYKVEVVYAVSAAAWLELGTLDTEARVD